MGWPSGKGFALTLRNPFRSAGFREGTRLPLPVSGRQKGNRTFHTGIAMSWLIPLLIPPPGSLPVAVRRIRSLPCSSDAVWKDGQSRSLIFLVFGGGGQDLIRRVPAPLPSQCVTSLGLTGWDAPDFWWFPSWCNSGKNVATATFHQGCRTLPA